MKKFSIEKKASNYECSIALFGTRTWRNDWLLLGLKEPNLTVGGICVVLSCFWERRYLLSL